MPGPLEGAGNAKANETQICLQRAPVYWESREILLTHGCRGGQSMEKGFEESTKRYGGDLPWGRTRERSMSEREHVMEKKQQPAGCLFERISLFDVRLAEGSWCVGVNRRQLYLGSNQLYQEVTSVGGSLNQKNRSNLERCEKGNHLTKQRRKKEKREGITCRLKKLSCMNPSASIP